MKKPLPTRLALAAATLVALTLAGCATPVAQHAVDVPATFAAATSIEDEPDLAWWESFGDPVLTQLVRRAASENRDIKMAAQRVRAARAGETISRSALLPSVGLSAEGSYSDTGRSAAYKAQSPDASRQAVGLDVSWELDITGRVRAGASAAEADAMAAQYGERGVRLLVVSDVATNYFTLVGAQRQLDTVRAISTAQDETLRLVTARQRVGLATAFDVERAQTAALQARAAIPPLETLAAVSRHRIAVLTGGQAGQASAIVPFNGAVVVPTTRTGQPASLLERRPDLLAMKAQLTAANFRRQQAAAEWFPRLFVGAMFGRDSLQLNSIDVGSSRFTNASALLAMPLFNAGRTQAINDIAESGQAEALARYEDGIVRALEDVENSLVGLREERTRSESLGAAATSADAALGRAQSLFERGQVDLLPLLDAQRARLSVRLGANESQTQLQLASVRLFKALGGGWQAFESPSKTH
ncbi:TolC family protein [Hydrogenophaga sp.]|uniref:efflux transporter outer membrane subunit n=1 Tax=Hydrogenophaga sp. TaxID=1904254 RepID=UPI0025B8D62D|nr:TolC family protein [Hydrogenophaga sp.]MBT9465605.1 TolC family protein [Hydrogenophaga sp.]